MEGGPPPFHSPAGLRWENEMKCRFGLASKKKIFSKIFKLVIYNSNKRTLIIKHLLP